MLNIQNSPYIIDLHYDNTEVFLRAISYGGQLYELFDKRFIFRGHSTDEYELVPSSLRGYLAFNSNTLRQVNTEEEKSIICYLATTELAQIEQEYKLLQDFFIVSDRNGLYVPHIEGLRNSFYPGIDGETLLLEGKWLPKDYWELAALAQHHGVKTRLLDWTHDLNVALYFASTGVYNDPKKKLDLQEAYKAHRKGEEYPPKHNIEIWALNKDVVLVNPIKVPLKIIQPKYNHNNNLCAQKGIFTFWETIKPTVIKKSGDIPNFKLQTDRRSLDVQLHEYLFGLGAQKKEYLYHITVPQEAAYSIYSYIEKIGYDASRLFPGYYGVARYLEEHTKIHTIN